MDGGGRDGRVVLSKRLRMLAAMVTPGNRLVDVGCDHGFLAIALVSRSICPRAIAMDVRRGPLAGAAAHVREFGLGDYIETRLSDGLSECGAGEADTMVCAGMGGRLMERILTDGMEKARQMQEVILQPQSELAQLRAFLRRSGFRVTEEDAVCEEGKYYFGMKAVWGEGADPVYLGACGKGVKPVRQSAGEEERLYDSFGELLLRQGHPVLLQYLRRREKYLRQLEGSLTAADSEKARRRLEEFQDELGRIRDAFSFYQPVS